MKITKRQLTQIIREERARLAEQADSETPMPEDPKGWPAWHNERFKRGFDYLQGPYLRTELAELLTNAVENYLGMRGGSFGLSAEDMRQLRAMLAAAADDIETEYK